MIDASPTHTLELSLGIPAHLFEVEDAKLGRELFSAGKRRVEVAIAFLSEDFNSMPVADWLLADAAALQRAAYASNQGEEIELAEPANRIEAARRQSEVISLAAELSRIGVHPVSKEAISDLSTALSENLAA